MTTDTFKIGSMQILGAIVPESNKMAYILYPMDVLQQWITSAARKHGVSIVVITGMDWDNDLTPWPAPGEPKGCPDFEGRAREFLRLLVENVVTEVEQRFSLPKDIERSLVGVSLSGLFTLWQWAMCGKFANIATLSGSFWYEGFEQWIFHQSFADKKGRCYMLLGEAEPSSNTPAFRRVGACTENIVGYMRRQGVHITFDMVPGNHFQYGIERLDKAFDNLFRPAHA